MPISWSYPSIRFYSVSAMISTFSTFVLRTVVVRFNQGEIWKTAFEKCLEQNSSRMVNPFFLQNMVWTQQEVCVWCSSNWRWSFTFVNVRRLLLSILVYPVTFRNTVKLATIVFFKRNDLFRVMIPEIVNGQVLDSVVVAVVVVLMAVVLVVVIGQPHTVSITDISSLILLL